MRRILASTLLQLISAAGICMSSMAFSATFTVTSIDDNGAGSLRQAIQDAASGDTINLAVSGTITLTTGELLITNDLAIIGPGATNLAVSGNSSSRVFEIGSNIIISISGLVLRGGRAPSGTNGIADGGNGSNGGGIYNQGTLTLLACTLTGNAGGGGGFGSSCSAMLCYAGRGGSGGNGGGIYNAGTLTLTGCTVSSNVAGGGGWGGSGYWAGYGGDGGHGGGIFNVGALILAGCTFSDNSTGTGGDGGYGYLRAPGGRGGSGGGTYNAGTLTSTSCTFSGNSCGLGGGSGSGIYNTSGSGGGIYNTGSANLRSVLVALNRIWSGCISGFCAAGPDLAGSFTSQGYNLIGQTNGSTGFTPGVNGDLAGTEASPLDPKIGPLQDNGGPTFTTALLPGSPAIDAGNGAGSLTDQRGRVRPVDNPAITNASGGDGSDIGAFELQSQPITLIWTQTSAPITNWASVASSADGSKLVAAVKGGPIYASPDSGATWTATSAPSTNWSSIASSADGTKLVATAATFNGSQYEGGGPIYVSTDSGATWSMTSAPHTNWASVASSADGSKLVAVAGGAVVYISSAPSGPIYTSSDSGATWIATSVTDANCTTVASSADGSKLVAGRYSGPFYFSRDSGAMWEEVAPTFAYLVSVASSADGTRLVAGTFDPFHPPGSGGAFAVFTSANSGATWKDVPAGSIGRGLVASSADGTRLVAAGGADASRRGGPIFVSIDSGATWTENGSPSTNWSSVASSSDGCKLAAVSNGGGIWTLQSTPAPSLSVARADTNIVLSWIVPSTDFALQENSDLATTNWTNIATTPALNFTTLQNQVVVSQPRGNRFYRLKQ